jgi:hypothetical protein
MGTTGKSAAGEAQFWSLEHPLTPGFASRMGIPEANVLNANFVESAVLDRGLRLLRVWRQASAEMSAGGLRLSCLKAA